MLKQISYCFIVILFMAACRETTTPHTQDSTINKEQQPEDAGHFGEMITAEKAIYYTQMLTDLGDKDSMETKVIGVISNVCQVKGCWMGMSAEGQEEMRIRFLDYGFFVPANIIDRNVVIKGKAYREVTSVADLKHYAEDEGLSKAEIDAITEPLEEVTFIATGVKIIN